MDAARRRRFRAWFARTYGTGPDARTRFMEESGKRGEAPLTAGRVSQFFDESQPFGERAARNIAVRMGLPEDYFVRDDRPLSQEAMDVAYSLDDLRETDPERWRRMLAFCSLAAIAEPPADPARREKWAADMVQLFRASVGLTADH